MLARYSLLVFLSLLRVMKIVLIAAISADGKIAQTADQSSMDWTSKEDTKFFIDKTKELGTVVMGRKTFATFNRPLKGRRLIVITKNPQAEPAMEGVEYTSEAPQALVTRLEAEGVTQLALAGGSSIYSQYLAAGLVNECYLTVEPVLFGTGVLLASGFDRLNLTLVDVSKLNDQAVLLHYTL